MKKFKLIFHILLGSFFTIFSVLATADDPSDLSLGFFHYIQDISIKNDVLYVVTDTEVFTKTKNAQTYTSLPHRTDDGFDFNNGRKNIAIATDGTIYVGTRYGMVLSGKMDQKNPFTLFTINRATTSDCDTFSYIDRKGSVYAGACDGLYMLQAHYHFGNPTTFSFDKISKFWDMRSMYVDAKETIYAGTDNGLFIGKKNAYGEYNFIGSVKLKDKKIVSLYVDDQGVIYAGTDNDLFIGKIDSTGDYAFTAAGLSNYQINSIAVSNNTGRMYIGTQNSNRDCHDDLNSGLVIGEKDNSESDHYSFSHISRNALKLNDNRGRMTPVTRVYLDEDAGIIYLGTDIGLISKPINLLGVS